MVKDFLQSLGGRRIRDRLAQLRATRDATQHERDVLRELEQLTEQAARTIDTMRESLNELRRVVVMAREVAKHIRSVAPDIEV